MPSPIGHSIAGLLLYGATAKTNNTHKWRRIALYLIAANAPDFDFLPGLIIGDPIRYHHGVTHSIGFAAIFAFACSLYLFAAKNEPFGRNYLIFFCLNCSHIVLDYFSKDYNFPYGILLLWPLNGNYYIAPFSLFLGIQRDASSTISYIISLFSLYNLLVAITEALLLFPFILFVFACKKKINLSAALKQLKWRNLGISKNASSQGARVAGGSNGIQSYAGKGKKDPGAAS